MAAGPSPGPAALHPDLLLVDQPGGTVVRRTAATVPGPWRVLLARRAHHGTGRVDQDLERQRPALQMDQDRRPDHRPHLPLLLTHLRTGTLGAAEPVRLHGRAAVADPADLRCCGSRARADDGVLSVRPSEAAQRHLPIAAPSLLA